MLPHPPRAVDALVEEFLLERRHRVRLIPNKSLLT